MTVVDALGIMGRRTTSPYSGRFYAYDVSTPASPTEIAYLQHATHTSQGVWVASEHWLSLSGGNTSAYSVEPDTATTSGTLIDTLTDASIGDTGASRNADGTVAVASAGGVGIATIDTSDPTALVLADTLTMTGAGDVVVVGSTAFVVDSNMAGAFDPVYLRAVSIDDPTNISVVGTYTFNTTEAYGGLRHIAHVGGGVLAVTTGDRSQVLLLIDASDRTAMTLLGSLDVTANALFTTPGEVTAINSGLVSVKNDQGVTGIDVSNTAAPSELGSAASVPAEDGVRIDDNTAAYACGTSGLKIVDWSTPATPSVLSTTSFSGTTLLGIDLYDLTLPAVGGGLFVGMLQIG